MVLSVRGLRVVDVVIVAWIVFAVHVVGYKFSVRMLRTSLMNSNFFKEIESSDT